MFKVSRHRDLKQYFDVACMIKGEYGLTDFGKARDRFF